MFIENRFQVFDGYLFGSAYSVQMSKYTNNSRLTMYSVDNMTSVCILINNKRHDLFFRITYYGPVEGFLVTADVIARLPQNIDKEFPKKFTVNSVAHRKPTMVGASEIFGN